MASSRSEVKDEVPQLQSPISPPRTLRRTGRQLDLTRSSRPSTPDPSPKHPQIGSSPRLSVALKMSETDSPRPKSNLQGFGSLLRLPWTRSTDSLSDRGYESQGSRRTSSSSSYSLLSRTGRDSRVSVTSATSLEDEETENSYEHPETKLPAGSHSLLRQSGNCTVLPEEPKHILTSDSETQTEQNGSICEEPHYSHSEILHQINRTVSSIDQRVQTVEVEVHSVKEKVMKINEKLNGIDNPQKDGPFRQQQSEQPFLVKGLTLIPEEEGSSRRSVILSPGKKREMRPWKSELLKGEYVEVDDVSIISVTVGRDQPLSENEIRAIVKKHCKKFVRHMNWVTILPTLESENLLDSHSAEFLMNTNTTSQLKGNFFFLSLLPSNGPDAYTRFYKCLADECVHEHAGHKFLFNLFQVPM